MQASLPKDKYGSAILHVVVFIVQLNDQGGMAYGMGIYRSWIISVGCFDGICDDPDKVWMSDLEWRYQTPWIKIERGWLQKSGITKVYLSLCAPKRAFLVKGLVETTELYYVEYFLLNYVFVMCINCQILGWVESFGTAMTVSGASVRKRMEWPIQQARVSLSGCFRMPAQTYFQWCLLHYHSCRLAEAWWEKYSN